MNLLNLKKHLERLLHLIETRSEEEDEDTLIWLLLGFLATYWDDRDGEAFKRNMLNALRDAYESLDPQGLYDDLIRRELADQSGYLSRFVQDLQNGKPSQAQAEARVKQYARSLGKLRERMEVEEETNRDRLYKWLYSETVEDHCRDCIDLNGQVHALSWFILTDHIPKSRQQRCGANCQCSLVPA